MAEEIEKASNQEKLVKISDVISLTLHNWPWLVLSVIVCLSIGFYYVTRNPPIYSRTAEILIKNDRNGASSQMEAFSEMGLMRSNTNLEDEVSKLTSPDNMTSVIKRLGIDKSYYIDGRFRRSIIYGETLPFTVAMPGVTDDQWVSLNVVVDKKGKISLSDLTLDGKEIELSKSTGINFGDSLHTAVGPIVVEKTPYYDGDKYYDVLVNKASLADATSAFSSELTVKTASERGNTIDLTVVDQSPQRAVDIINTLIAVYNENWIKARNLISVSTSEFINDRLNVIESELGDVDHDISSFKSEHQMPDVQQAAAMYMSESQQASSQILDLNNQLQMARYVRNFMTNNSNRHQLLPANTGVAGNIESQIGEYNEKMVLRNQYASNSSDANPLVEALDSQLAAMRVAIVQSIDNQIVALNTSLASFQGSKNRATAQIAANPNQAKYLLSVERQQKVKESLYLYLLQKREENELSQAFTAYNTEVIMKPIGNNIPTTPSRDKVLIISFLIGLFIPFGVNYLRESMNTKIRGRKDVDGLTLPFVGEIPLYQPNGKKNMGLAKSGDKSIVVQPGSRDVINEAFRVARTNLELMRIPGNNANVLAFTSFNPNSGKSFIAMNLAYAFAIKKKRVLVIDGDLRHGSASRYIGNECDEGLSNYLNGTVSDVHSLIYTDPDVPTLNILPIGPIPPNPTELLETPRFQEMVESLRSEFDYIFIDCPPIEIVADAQIINPVADRTIFIIRAGLFERTMLPELEKINAEKKLKNMAFILNGTKSHSGRYSYSYSYGYGYGYGYYVSNEKISKNKTKQS